MNKILLILSIALVLVVTSVGVAKASRSYFVAAVQTASATSSVTSLVTGVSTSLTLDSYVSIPSKIDNATLLLQVVASSSASTVSITQSFSQDGIDWFEDNIATTSTSNAITQGNYLTLAGNTTSSTTRKAVDIKTPVRYTKLTLTSTVGTSTVWAQIVPARQLP